jgi:hypothetical protein
VSSTEVNPDGAQSIHFVHWVQFVQVGVQVGCGLLQSGNGVGEGKGVGVGVIIVGHGCEKHCHPQERQGLWLQPQPQPTLSVVTPPQTLQP